MNSFLPKSAMYWYNKILRKLVPRVLPAPSPKERALIDTLRAQIRALPEILPDEGVNRAEQFWMENRVNLRRELLSKDPRAFLNFPVICETMFLDDPPYIAHELKALRSSPAWRNRWCAAIRESVTIPAPACPYYSKSSGNLIHQASHLWHFEQVTGLDISRFGAILEFGGGYGSLCRLVRQLGFNGRFFIFDLPEFSALQEFYLRANDIPISSFASPTAGAICLSEFEQLRELNPAVPIDLFLATWSLSETPFAFRRQVLGTVRARNWLIAYQHEFESLDNAEFFADWSRENPAYRWQNIPLSHMPGRHSYLVGTQLGNL